MTYKVIVAERAKSDLIHYFQQTRKHAPNTAYQWLNRFEEAIGTLDTFPERCPLAPEDRLVEATIRQFFFGKKAGRFRVLFTIRDQEVIVVHIRRGSMDDASADDLSDL